MYKSKHVSISINCTPQKVYDFASNGENLTKWAAGLSQSSVKKSGEFWICESPMGSVKVQFAPQNTFGVMDHDVTLPSGEVNHNPFRVIQNDQAAEVIFTLYKRLGMNDQDFEKDALMIKKDLEILKALLEVKS
jgi:hypothetical protein